jgi:hypothetical protein
MGTTHVDLSPNGDEPDTTPETASRVLRYAVAAALAGAGVIHFAYAPHHLDENTSHGLFFLLMGWTQLGLAALVARNKPLTRPVVAFGVLLNVGIIAVWVVSRTAGISGQVEAVGFPDALCTVLEGFAALGLVAALGSGFTRWKVPQATSGAFIGGAVVAIALLATASMVPALGGGHGDHEHGAEAGAAHDDGVAHDATAVAAHDAGSHDAGSHDAGSPTTAATGAHDAGSHDATTTDSATAVDFNAQRKAAFLGGLSDDEVAKRTAVNRAFAQEKVLKGSKKLQAMEPAERDKTLSAFMDWTVAHATDEAHGGGGHSGNHVAGPAVWQWIDDPDDRAALEAQLKTSAAVPAQYPTAADATKAGYFQVTPWVPGIGAHYINIKYTGSFDPAHPSILLYGGNEPTSPIVGVSYAVYADKAPEGFVGPNDYWHLHPALCMVGAWVAGPDNTPGDLCKSVGGEQGDATDKSGLFMMHLWQVPGYESPWGLFSGENPNLNLATEDLPAAS